MGWCPTAGVSWGCGRAPGVTVLSPGEGTRWRCHMLPLRCPPAKGHRPPDLVCPHGGGKRWRDASCLEPWGCPKCHPGMGGVREQPDSLPSSQSPSLIGGSDELELPSLPSPKYICFITFSICFRISETLFFFFFLSRSYLKPHCPYLLLSAPSTHPAPNQSPVLTSHPAGCVLGGGSAPVPRGHPPFLGLGLPAPLGELSPLHSPCFLFLCCGPLLASVPAGWLCGHCSLPGVFSLGCREL